MTIYVDVLICTNFVIDYFLLSFTARILKYEIKFSRQLIGSAVASISSLIVLIPENLWIIGLILRLLSVPIIILSVYGKSKPWVYFKRIFTYFAVSFVFSGFMEAILQLLKPKGLKVINGVVYYDLSVFLLIGLTVLIYLILTVFSKYFARKHINVKNVTVVCRNNEVQIECIVDSGNKLREPFSGTPVMLIDSSFSNKLIFSEKTSRVIPYSTVTGEGILMGYKADEVFLSENPSEKLNLYLAFSKTKIEGNLGGILPLDAI